MPQLAVTELRWFLCGYLMDSNSQPDAESLQSEEQVQSLLSERKWRMLLQIEKDALGMAEKMERRRLKSRTKRCLKNSTSFKINRKGARRVFHLQSFPLSSSEDLAEQIPGGEFIKVSNRGWVARNESTGRELVVKFCRYSFLEKLAALFGSHRLKRAWVACHGLRVRLLPTPLGLALVEQRRWGLLECAWLIQEAVPGGRSLDQYLWQEYGSEKIFSGTKARNKFSVAREIGTLLRRLHDSGIRMHDFSPQNVLVLPQLLNSDPKNGSNRPGKDVQKELEEGEIASLQFAIKDHPLWFVDLDDVRFRQSLNRRCRERNLIQIGNLPEGHVSVADRLRALRTYDAGEKDFYRRDCISQLRHGLHAEAFRTIQRMTRQEYLGEIEI